MQPKIFKRPSLLKKLPAEVKILFEIFGDQARLVGGSVRDLLLKKEVSDFDFATKLLPQEVTKILEKNKIKAVPTGIKFGTITAVINHKNFEITTLRKDHDASGRHCAVEFIDDYFFDAARRDFSINALYLDSRGFVYDYFSGIFDLRKHTLHFIGDAKERISEDFLRIMRFFRFSCNYAKKPDSKGLKACIEQKSNLKKLSRERIRQEFLKLLDASNRKKLIAILKILQSKKIASEIFSAKLDIKALERFFLIEEKLKIKADLTLKLAILFLQKNFDLQTFSHEIRLTNAEKKWFSFFIKNFSKPIDLENLKLSLAFENAVLVKDFYLFKLAKKGGEVNYKEAKKILNYVKKFSLPKFEIDGEDVKKFGFKKEKIGWAISKAKGFWAKNNFSLSKTELFDFLKNLINQSA